MKASKTGHKGEERIKVEFPCTRAMASLIKQNEYAKWSKTIYACHVTRNKREFN
jgi:hypothetical protein